MIVVKFELHSAVTGKVTEIGRAVICNDGTGSLSTGNYNVRLTTRDGRPWRSGRVERFPRKRLGVYDLMLRALRACLPEKRNPVRTKEAA